MSLLGETLRYRREQLRLGQKGLAQHVGVSQQTLSRWERAEAIPRPQRVAKLAEVLDLDCAHLHRLAGYLPEEESSALSETFRELYAGMSRLSRSELMLLIDRAWEELRRREGLAPPGLP